MNKVRKYKLPREDNRHNNINIQSYLKMFHLRVLQAVIKYFVLLLLTHNTLVFHCIIVQPFLEPLEIFFCTGDAVTLFF